MVHVKLIENEPLLVGKDAANILGYQNASKALADHVDDEDNVNNESLSSLGQRGCAQTMNAANESGLYSLVLGSRKPKASSYSQETSTTSASMLLGKNARPKNEPPNGSKKSNHLLFSA